MKNNFLKKKNSITKIIAIFVMLLAIVCYSCRDELWDSAWEKYEVQAIEDAKAWYEDNKPEMTSLLSPDGIDQVLMEPEWTHAFATKNEKYEVIETDIMSQGRILFVDESCVEKYEETKDLKYRQCYTRIVFRTDRKTNETVGFLMTVVPNLDWLEKSRFKPFMEATYLYRSKNFGGMILFHEMDGSYSNGWTYENGKIVAKVNSLNAELSDVSLRAQVCRTVPYSVTVEICGPELYIGAEINGVDYWASQGRNCSTSTSYSSQLECYDDGSSNNQGGYNPPAAGGGGSSGGGTGNTGTPTPVPRTDCEGGANTRSNNAKIITNNVSASYINFMNYTSMASEYTARIDWNGSNYVMSSPEPGGTNSSYGTIQINTMYAMHTHTIDSEPPSPKDFSTLLDANNFFYRSLGGSTGYNLQGAIVINNNTEYLISIVDRQKAYNFSNSSNANIFAPYTGNGNAIFNNSAINNEFNSIISNLVSQGYKDPQSNYAYAMSYLLEKYNTGLTVSTKTRSESSFKELKTNNTNNSYKPTRCP